MTQEKPHSLIANHDQIRGLLATYGPPALQRLRDDALERYAKVGLPTHKDEEFKYTPLVDLREMEFLPAYGSNIFRDDLANTTVGKIEGITLAFANGEFAPSSPPKASCPKGSSSRPCKPL